MFLWMTKPKAEMKNYIRSLRQRRGLTLRELADSLQTTPQSISRLETGNMTLSVDWLQRFASALRVHPTELLESPKESHIPLVGSLGGDGNLYKPLDKKFNLTVNANNPIAVEIGHDIGDYRSGDILIADRLPTKDLTSAAGRDCLTQTLAGQVMLGRLIAVAHAVRQKVGGGDVAQIQPVSYFLYPLNSGITAQNSVLSIENNTLWIGPIVMRMSYF